VTSPSTACRHEAFLYQGEDDYLATLLPFIADARAKAEPVLVAVPGDRLDVLRARIDGAPGVEWLDLQSAGRNPARIIPVWEDFLDRHRDAPRLRGIGEPLWSSRQPDERVECTHHESLLNVAFERQPLWLLCPYDAAGLDRRAIDDAHACHPFVLEHGRAQRSASFPGVERCRRMVAGALAPVPADAEHARVDADGIGDLRHRLAASGERTGLTACRVADLVLAADELVANSVEHGGGVADVAWWPAGSRAAALVCEVRDTGIITDPLVGRRRPASSSTSGRGLWLANQVSDLIQIRSSSGGTVVRVTIGQPDTD
jgi:anti-sigma regulatory factor (Ser/Thr protein kinase)